MAGDENEMEVNGMEHTASEVVHEESVHIQDITIFALPLKTLAMLIIKLKQIRFRYPRKMLWS